MSVANNTPRLVQRAVLIIEQNYMYLYGVEDISDKLGVSKSHLIREFSKYMGISPLKYLTKFKLEQSKTLLVSEKLHIDTIANMVGFANGNYFSKVFRKEYDMSPTEFINSTPIIIGGTKDEKVYL